MRAQQRELLQLDDVGQLLDELPARSLFLVVDRAAYDSSGACQLLRPHLDQRHVVEFDNFDANPKLEHVEVGIEAFRSGTFDVVVAVGGGTAIDMAKLIRCFASQSGSPMEIIEDSRRIVRPSPCPLVAIPTTAGTGSEATHFAVVYVAGVKYSVAHEFIFPEVSIVDPQLTASMPPRLTAVTGLDVLCQAVESMWSVHSTSESHGYAAEALELVLQNLPQSVGLPTLPVRAAMSHAANLAGKAINISKTTAPHAVSYAITKNHGVPHGLAAALTLAPFLVFNAGVSVVDVVDRRGPEHVLNVIQQIAQILGCESAGEAARAITAFMRSIRCETRLLELNITSDADRNKIARSVNTTRLANNPRAVRSQDIFEILDSIR